MHSEQGIGKTLVGSSVAPLRVIFKAVSRLTSEKTADAGLNPRDDFAEKFHVALGGVRPSCWIGVNSAFAVYMHLSTILPLLVSYGVAVSAKVVLRVCAQWAIDRADARDSAIDHGHGQSPQETWFDGQQLAILQKWQRRFSGTMDAGDWQIAA